MCYLVSSMPPAASAGVRQTQMRTFEDAEGAPARRAARTFAAAQLLAGHSEVRLWKLVDEPTLTKAVSWPILGEGE